jgi:hypothetical protein
VHHEIAWAPRHEYNHPDAPRARQPSKAGALSLSMI